MRRTASPVPAWPDFLRHILGQTKLPSREAKISESSTNGFVDTHIFPPRNSCSYVLYERAILSARESLLWRASESRRSPVSAILNSFLIQPNSTRY